jgi:UDP-N-acetylmuramoyl-L-alanyl-D-glutamate--2,6-diaminopimelate ligase
MKTLKDILPSNIIETVGNLDTEITGICFNSRKIKKGDLFVALSGNNIDGSIFLFDAIQHGAVAAVIEGNRKNVEVPIIKVHNARAALSEISAKFYDNPSEKIKLIGITGTKGKTTISYMVQSILKKAYDKAFRMGTIDYDMVYNVIPANNTTPESQVIHSLMEEALEHDIKYGVIEVSSHSLKMFRVENLNFSVAGFTNLSLEHTEFHPNMDDYYNTKKRLFFELAYKDKKNVIGIDNDYGMKLYKECKKAELDVVSVSVNNKEADIYVSDANIKGCESSFVIHCKGEEKECRINMGGEYNVFNALMAAGMTSALGVSLADICEGLESLKAVPGRLEAIENDKGINVVVDYAHSPDALNNVLHALRPVTEKKLITVFGCGGNRSHEKRPVMGRTALENSDVVIVTSDNPRKEDPQAIIDEIMAGIKSTGIPQGKSVSQIVDRKEAIISALNMAEAGDTVLIAGKGHETGQYFSDHTIPFDDREVARSYFIYNKE